LGVRWRRWCENHPVLYWPSRFRGNVL